MGRMRDAINALRGKKAPESAVTVTKTRADCIMTSREAIYAAVSRISTAIASMPCHLYRGGVIQRNDPLERLLAYQPNCSMTGYIFRLTMQANVGLEGRAYALIRPAGDGNPAALDVLDPMRVEPMRNTDDGEIWYRVNAEGAKQMWVHSSGMLVLKYLCTNGENGIRPTDVLRNTLEYDAQMKEFSKRQVQGTNTGVFLETPSNVGKEQALKLANDFLEVYTQTGKQVVMLQGGMKATQMQQSPLAQGSLDVERMTINRVATVYNIPSHLLGDYGSTSFASQEQQTLEFRTLTLLPIVTQWEEELNQKLLTYDRCASGYSFRFDMDALTRADTAARGDYYQKAVRSGWHTINDIRAKEFIAPYERCGNTPLASKDLWPLERLEKGDVNNGGKV